MPRPRTALAGEIRTIRASFRRLACSFSRIAPILTALLREVCLRCLRMGQIIPAAGLT